MWLALGMASERLDHALGLTARLILIDIARVVEVCVVAHFLDDERPVTHGQHCDVVLHPGQSERAEIHGGVIQIEGVSAAGMSAETNRRNVVNEYAREVLQPASRSTERGINSVDL